jgi:hydroxymethylpyrimidine pyrophosphatase-like HAD family hydrolase
MKKKIFCFDLDNTLCSTSGKNYKKSKPKKEAIKTLNSLFNKGYFIKIHTARYMGRSKDKLKNKKELHLKISKQLKYFGIKYHKLFISKPSADIYIDDKGFGYDKSWIKKFRNYE